MRAVIFTVLAACTPGVIDGPGGSNMNGPDGGGGGGGASDGSVSSDGSAAFACRNKVTVVGDGHHNAGQDCQQGCHNHGFTLSGTVYAGTTALSGASITVVDAANKTFDMVSQANGNFYTANAVTFPITVTASSCPDVKAMVGQVTTAANGGCNKTGCHQAGAQGPIHLP